MPKITAPTVSEHRATKRAQLLAAGESILLADGLAGVTPRAVCERAGLARSTFYVYFSTIDDLIVAIAIAAMEEWDAEIERTLAAAEPGLDELAAFVRSTMEMTADGKHQIAGILRGANLSPSRIDDLMALHDLLLRPLTRVLEDLGVPADRERLGLVHAVIAAGMESVSRGTPAERAASDVIEFLRSGIGGLIANF